MASHASSIPIIDAGAPPERLAVFRILCGTFTVSYFAVRSPAFTSLADRSPTSFDGVGVWALRDAPLPPALLLLLLAVVIAAGGAATLGYRYRATAPVFAFAVLLLTSYRSSWGQLLHFENLFVLHLLVLAFAPAADVWSLDVRRRPPAQRLQRDAHAYGYPLALSAVIVIITYVLAGIAKLRYGGVEWIDGDTLQNHIAYSAARLELLGGSPSPLAAPLVEQARLLPWFAAVAVATELTAPIALVGPRSRRWWVAAAWLLHVGIMGSMFIVFPYPLTLVAFAPLFELEWLAVPMRRRFQHRDTY